MLEKLDVTFMIRSKALFPAGWTETLLSATGRRGGVGTVHCCGRQLARSASSGRVLHWNTQSRKQSVNVGLVLK